MNCHYNKVVMFIYSFGIVLMGTVITAAAAQNECRGPGQPCGNVDAGTTTSVDNMWRQAPRRPQRQLSANTTCCDNMECNVLSETCKFPGLTCRKENQKCGFVDDNPFFGVQVKVSDDVRARLSFDPFCCPGLQCGSLGICYKPDIIKCREEGESCRLNGCCGGLHCNPVENDHTGEEQYKCQKKTCNTDGTCSTLGGSGCCDSHYCKAHWGVVGLCTARRN